ncbi:MAG: hypothetical protein V1490_02105 [Candidatus Omnitrophota bacterium]
MTEKKFLDVRIEWDCSSVYNLRDIKQALEEKWYGDFTISPLPELASEEEIKSILTEVLDEYFPKGKCSERGCEHLGDFIYPPLPNPPLKPEEKKAKIPGDINYLADEVHKLAWEKGWHNKEEGEDAFVERACNNLHNEISELHEAWRGNKLRELCSKAEKMRSLGIEPLTCIEEEMADIVIRVLDNARKLNVDILSAIQRKHNFNKTRELRHGGKRS